MKKKLCCSATLAMLMGMYLGCGSHNPISHSDPHKGSTKAAPQITVVDQREKVKPEESLGDLDVIDQGPKEDTCMIIPKDPKNCIPCEGNAKAVTFAEAKKFLTKDFFEACKDQFQQEPTCTLMKAVKVGGGCEAVPMTEADKAEAKKHAKEMEGQRGQGGQMGGGGQMGRPGTRSRGMGSPSSGERGNFNIADPSFGQGQSPFASGSPLGQGGYSPTGGFQGGRQPNFNHGISDFGRSNQAWSSPHGYDRGEHAWDNKPLNQWSNKSRFSGDQNYMDAPWGRKTGYEGMPDWSTEELRFGKKHGSHQGWR